MSWMPQPAVAVGSAVKSRKGAAPIDETLRRVSAEAALNAAPRHSAKAAGSDTAKRTGRCGSVTAVWFTFNA